MQCSKKRNPGFNFAITSANVHHIRGVARNLLRGGGTKEGLAPRSRRHILNVRQNKIRKNSTQQKRYTVTKFPATTRRGMHPCPLLTMPLHQITDFNHFLLLQQEMLCTKVKLRLPPHLHSVTSLPNNLAKHTLMPIGAGIKAVLNCTIYTLYTGFTHAWSTSDQQAITTQGDSKK